MACFKLGQAIAAVQGLNSEQFGGENGVDE